MKHKIVLFAAMMIMLLLCLSMIGSALSVGSVIEKQSAEKCFAAASDSVFYVRAYNKSGSLKSTGSGFTVSEKGLAVTAAHVVTSAAKVTAIFNGKEIAAKVLVCDTASDVAVIQLSAGKYSHIQTSDKRPATGAVVYAVGYPSKDIKIITQGVVNTPEACISGKDRMLVSCDIVNGMSGGPILNEYGQAIGMCSGSIRTMTGIHLSPLTEEIEKAIAESEEEKK